jgi:hypothetical protein
MINIFTGLLLLVVLGFHFYASRKKPYKRDRQRLVIVLFNTVLMVVTFVRLGLQNQVQVLDIVIATAAYGVALYVLLCDALLSGLAAYLTERRGDKWTKEMDYFYLVLGALGLYGAINRMPNIVLTFSALDVMGPVVLITALVIRFVKTRAEIEGWNKQPLLATVD